MYKLPEMRGGGEVIRAMPERKHSFFCEVFPKWRGWVVHPKIFEKIKILIYEWVQQPQQVHSPTNC